MTLYLWYSLWSAYSNETVTLRKHITKYKNVRKWMDKFLWKCESHGIKTSRVNSLLITKSINLLQGDRLQIIFFILFTWKKNILNKQYVSWGLKHSLFLWAFSVKRKENDLHKNIRFLGALRKMHLLRQIHWKFMIFISFAKTRNRAPQF